MGRDGQRRLRRVQWQLLGAEDLRVHSLVECRFVGERC